MTFDKHRLSTSGLFVYLLCLFISSTATSESKITNDPQFIPGREVRIDVDDRNIGGGHFVIYVPSDYTDDCNWPVIFFYHGAGCKPSADTFRKITKGDGFIIIAMEYVQVAEGRMRRGEYINYLKRELKSIVAVKAYISKHLKIDKKRLFITGISKGGWVTSDLAERSAKAWAGIAILCAGRRGAASAINKKAIRGKSIYIGAGKKDPNLSAAKKAAAYYERLGAKVTFEVYKGLGHEIDPNSQTLRNWLITNSSEKSGDSTLASETPGQHIKSNQ